MLFSLRKQDFAECHIAMSKLLDFYSISGEYNKPFLQAVLLFRFYNSSDMGESIKNVHEMLQFVLPLKCLSYPIIKDTMRMINHCIQSNVFALRKIRQCYAQEDAIKLMLDLIESKTCKHIAQQLPRAYSVSSEAWICNLLQLNDAKSLGDLGIAEERFQITDGKVKFLKNGTSIKSSQ